MWIKIFTWFFMIAGGMIPIIFLIGLTGTPVQLALYGLQTDQAFSLYGIIISVLFAFKGIAAFGLWMEKDWGINMAIADAFIGILVCSFIMLILPIMNTGYQFVFRLELVLLIPYLLKLHKIKLQWLKKKG
ncbi:MAG TPA: hypothetical protein VNS32_20900 [Flavisolibacter sp.]|nr:hypothetical protein [Flavisolibacter sp.]